MRLQIALEFMLVFSFVIAVFVVFFYILAVRSSSFFNQEAFSQAQLISQFIAQQLNIALNSGNGYSSNVILQSGYGLNQYTINITPTGIVTVTANIVNQKLSAIAYSQARSLLIANTINPSTLQLQNFFGLICVDVNCPPENNFTSSMTMQSQAIQAARFNGNSYISVNPSDLPSGSAARSVFAWIYWAPRTTSCTLGTNCYAIFDYGNGNGAVNQYSGISIVGNDLYFTGTSDNYQSTLAISQNKWHFVGFTYNTGSASVTLYVDGQAQTGALSPDGQALSTVLSEADIGRQYSSTGYLQYFYGDMANIQVYSTALSASQVYKLYTEGIEGAPVATNSVVAWWQLNGNAYDYSGNNNTGTTANIVYPTAVQLSPRVNDPFGKNVNGILVGFGTNLGNFTKYPYMISYTSSNGVATSFLTQNLTSGPATITSMPYPGNVLEEQHLVLWYPLTQGFAKPKPSQQQLYVLDQGTNTISVINTTTNQVSKTISLGFYGNPVSMVVSPNGEYLYVDTYNTSSAYGYMIEISTQLNSVVSAGIFSGFSGYAPPGSLAISQNGDYIYSIVEPSAPYGTSTVYGMPTSDLSYTEAALDYAVPNPSYDLEAPDNQHVYVLDYGDNLIDVLNTSGCQGSCYTSKSINVGPEPYHLAVTPNDKYVYITDYGSDEISVLNTTNYQVSNVLLGQISEPYHIAITPNGKYAYITDFGSSSVSVVNTTSYAVNTIPVGANPGVVAITPNSKYVYVADTSILFPSISIINTTSNKVVDTINLGLTLTPQSITITPNSDFAYVTVQSLFGGYVYAINTTTFSTTQISVGAGPINETIATSIPSFTTYDLSGYNNTGTANSVTQPMPSQNIGGISFTGGASQLTVPGNTPLYIQPQNTGMTIFMWVYLNASESEASQMAYNHYTGEPYGSYFLNTTGGPSCPNGGGYSMGIVTPPYYYEVLLNVSDNCGHGFGEYITLNQNAWYNLAFTIAPGANSLVTGYLDGVKIAQGSSNGKWVSGNSWNSLCIGSTCYDPQLFNGQYWTPPIPFFQNQYFSGQISDVQLYNTNLTGPEIYELYTHTSPPLMSNVTVPLSISH